MKIPVPVPEDAALNVHIGQQVTFGTPFYTRKASHTTTIPLAETLKFQPERIFMALKKVIGDKVKKGDLLAEHKSFFATRHYVANVDGILVEVDHKKGSVTIQLDSGSERIVPCYFTGEIHDIAPTQVVLQIGHMQEVQLAGTAPQPFGARVYYISANTDISDEAIEQHIICAADIDPLMSIKLSALGATGIITNNRQNAPEGVHLYVAHNAEEFDQALTLKYPNVISSLDRNVICFYS